MGAGGSSRSGGGWLGGGRGPGFPPLPILKWQGTSEGIWQRVLPGEGRLGAAAWVGQGQGANEGGACLAPPRRCGHASAPTPQPPPRPRRPSRELEPVREEASRESPSPRRAPARGRAPARRPSPAKARRGGGAGGAAAPALPEASEGPPHGGRRGAAVRQRGTGGDPAAEYFRPQEDSDEDYMQDEEGESDEDYEYVPRQTARTAAAARGSRAAARAAAAAQQAAAALSGEAGPAGSGPPSTSSQPRSAADTAAAAAQLGDSAAAAPALTPQAPAAPPIPIPAPTGRGHLSNGPCMNPDCEHPYDSPQWRKGPPNAPVLCNACGTRWLRNGTLKPLVVSAPSCPRLAQRPPACCPSLASPPALRCATLPLPSSCGLLSFQHASHGTGLTGQAKTFATRCRACAAFTSS